MNRFTLGICLLLFTAIASAVELTSSSFVTMSGTNIAQKVIVTDAEAQLFPSFEKESADGKPVAQMSIFYRLPDDGKNDEKNGMYKVGNSSGDFLGWISKDSVTLIPSFVTVVSATDKPLAIYSSMESKESVELPSKTIPFIVPNSKAIERGYVEVICVPWDVTKKPVESSKPEDTEADKTTTDTPADDESPADKDTDKEADKKVDKDTEDADDKDDDKTVEEKADDDVKSEPDTVPADKVKKTGATKDNVPEIVFVIDTTATTEDLIKIFNTVVGKIAEKKINVRLGLVEYRDKENDFKFDANYTCPLTDDIDEFIAVAKKVACENEDVIYNSEVFTGLKMAIDETKWSTGKKNVILFSVTPSKDIFIKGTGETKGVSPCDIKTASQMKSYLKENNVSLFAVHSTLSTNSGWGARLRTLALKEASKELENMGLNESNIVTLSNDNSDIIVKNIMEYISQILEQQAEDKEDSATESQSTSTLTKSSKVESDSKSKKETAEEADTDEDEAKETSTADSEETSSVTITRGFIKIYNADEQPTVKVQFFATRESLQKLSRALSDAQRKLNMISAKAGGNIRILSNTLIMDTLSFINGEDMKDKDISDMIQLGYEQLPSEFFDGVFNTIPKLKNTSPKLKTWCNNLNQWNDYTKTLLNTESKWSELPDGTKYLFLEIPEL